MDATRRPAYGIGQLSELSGLPVKTIRFYSDSGLLPARRTESGHRRYDEGDLARLRLIRALRDLDLSLPTIGGVLEGHDQLADVLRAHAVALEARVRSLQRQQVVLRLAAADPSPENLGRLHVLTRLDAEERRRLLEELWERATGSDEDTELRRQGLPELGEDASPEQLEAWLELATLASDPDYQHAVLDHLALPLRGDAAWRLAQQAAMERLAEMAARGVPPGDEDAAPAVDEMAEVWAQALGRTDSPEFRAWLLGEVEARTDIRIARYWELVAKVRGQTAAVHRGSGFQWWLEALRASIADQD
jgi:DNA-binding transcriptional MerR regulator